MAEVTEGLWVVEGAVIDGGMVWLRMDLLSFYINSFIIILL